MSILQSLLNHYAYAVILSAHSDSLDTEYNALADTIIQLQLKSTGLLFSPVVGCYKGKHEQSYIVFCNEWADVDRLEKIALKGHQQECILVIAASLNIAQLVYADSVHAIGNKLQQVASTEGLEAYTLVDGVPWAVV